jgi:hypothetical protein
MLTEQFSTLPSLLLPSLLKHILSLLDIHEQGLLGALGLTQGTLGAVSPVPAQAPQRLDLAEKHIRMGHGRSAP